MTSELLISQEAEREICELELKRRLKSIGFTDKQIEEFITTERAIIDSRKSNDDDEKFMAEKKFFSYPCPRIKLDELTISELLLITEEATNEYPSARARDFEYFEIISTYARQFSSKSYDAAIEKLKKFGLEDKSIKKFIFAEWQVIRRVTFNDERAVDAWGNPEKHLN